MITDTIQCIITRKILQLPVQTNFSQTCLWGKEIDDITILMQVLHANVSTNIKPVSTDTNETFIEIK